MAQEVINEETPDSRANPRAPGRMRARIQICILGAILVAPSLWMVATTPPLWRDMDAYAQVTESLAHAAYDGHGSLYCLALRVPLYVGYEVERLTGRILERPRSFFIAPVVTDTGIFLLVAMQHLALAASVLFLVTTAARNFPIRLLLAFFWAANPIFPTFAQCVGSETLSMIGLILLTTIGWRLLRQAGAPSWQRWTLFGSVLFLCILTRSANSLLGFLLPIVFLFRLRRVSLRRDLRCVLIAAAIGLACSGLARLSTGMICRAGNFSYSSHLGFTFLWRLRFLQSVPEPRRSALLDRVAETMKEAAETFGGLDIVIAGQAGNFYAPVLGMSASAFKSVIDIDLQGTFNLYRASFEYLRTPGASLIAITAPEAVKPLPFQSHVCAAKAAVNMLTKCLAIEWGPVGIRVNGISAFWNLAIAPVDTFTFEIDDSFANPGSNTCANIGRIRTSFADGSHATTELIMVYVVNDHGLVTSMKAFWEPDRTMASFTKG